MLIYFNYTQNKLKVKQIILILFINELIYLIVENGEWRMENGEWRMENGEWRIVDQVIG
jgi:hypothetical protein